MKKFLFLGLVAGASMGAQGQLIITGVIDGPLSGGVPKAVAFYAESDIPDLGIYGVESANNGNPASAPEFTFPSIALNAGETIYLASEETGFNAFFGFNPNYTSGALSINGDDAIVLYQNSVAIDAFGEIGVDGTGEAWDYTDGWAHRHSGKIATTSFNNSDWLFSGTNALDGETNNASASSPFPITEVAGVPISEPTPPPSPVPATTPVSISAIQGSGNVAAMLGNTVTVEAVVIGDFQDSDADEARNLGGFYLQEETTDEDGDTTTSEGIFVLSEEPVELGQIVHVTGTVAELFGTTVLNAISSVEVINTEDMRILVTPAIIDLALNTDVIVINQNNLAFQANLEAYENMWVQFSGELSISEQFNLNRFNEIRLVAGERPFQFTQKNTPNSVLYEQSLRQLAARSIVYDDGLSSQNIGIDFLEGFAPYNEVTAKRIGDTVTDLSGVLTFAFNTWRVRSTQENSNLFTSSLAGNSPNPRPTIAPQISGNLKIASFNVLNFFSTLNDGSKTLSGLNPRGANNADELERQQAKLVNAIVAIDADVLGLLELENEFDSTNDGSTAIEILVNAINDKLGAAVYTYVYPGVAQVGTDAIAAGFMYKPAVVEIAEGSFPAILNDATASGFDVFTSRDFSADPIFDGLSSNRNSIAVTFNHIATNDAFTAVVNHFKSKGGNGSGANADARDGAGNFNQRRLDAAMAVVEWLKTNPTAIVETDHVILGDLNAYAQEEPVQYLLGQGFNNVEDEEAYSFVFDGQIGTLDYILLNDAFYAKLHDAAIWHINADEASALDYNLDFGRDENYFNGATATRNSDHDPLYIGLNMQASILSFKSVIKAYLESVKAGEITGNHKFAFVAKWQLHFYYSLLRHAKYAYQQGQIQHACAKLNWASRLSDGEKHPHDLIIGLGVNTVFSDVKTLISQHCK